MCWPPTRWPLRPTTRGTAKPTPQLCDGMTSDDQMDHDAAARDIQGAPLCDDMSSETDTENENETDTTNPKFGSSSTSTSASVELTFTSAKLTQADVDKIGADGGSVELFLEDDFVVPDSISSGSIYFTLTKPTHRFAGGGRSGTRRLWRGSQRWGLLWRR